MSSNFILIYCSENQAIVNKFTSDLSTSGAKFNLYAADQQSNLRETLNTSEPIILLVTDNFLKNRNCMLNAYSNFGHLIKNGQILPIIADGYVQKNDGTLIPVSTRIERVANVIQYMNYWQDKYLSMRKEHNLGNNTEEEVNIIKTISTEVGDFARLLKDSNFQYFENLSARNYQLFCQIAGLPLPTHTALSNEPAIEVVQPYTTETKENEVISPKLEEIIVENKEIEEVQHPIIAVESVNSPEKEDDAIEQIIADIPGLSLINNPIPIVEKKEENLVKEIDEDDFFNPSKDIQQGSNVNEIMEEIILEEENEANQIMPIHEEVTIDDIFEDEPQEEKVIENEDDVDDIFNNITKGKIDEKVEINLTEEKFENDIPSENLIENNSIMDIFKDTENETIELVSQSANQEDNSIEYDEESVKNQLIEAFRLAKMNDFKNATHILENILDKDDQNADAFFILAEISELNKDFIMSKAYYEKTISIAPFYPLVYEKLAKLSAAHFKDDKKQTKKYFKKALKIDENNTELIYAYAEFLNDQMDNPEKAIKYFEKVLEIEPEHPFANYDLAVTYYKIGDKKVAAEYYRNACENNEEFSTEENDDVFLNYTILDLDRADEAINLHNNEDEENFSPIEKEEQETEDTNEAKIIPIVINEESNKEEAIENEIVSEAAIQEIQPSKDKSIPIDGAKIVLITGSTAGIGKATAEIFAKNGYNVILTGRRQERLLELETEFREKYDGSCIAIDFDVQNFQSIQDAYDSLEENWKNIDILVNNAGLALGLDPIHEGNIAHWDTMIDTNIKGLLYMTRMIAPKMVERRSGHIINLCSTAGKEAYHNGNVYCATKFAVEALTKTMRIDLHKFGIRVGQVSPGAVETEFSNVRFEGDTERAAKVYDGFTPLVAEDVADIIYYMASAPAHVNIQDVLVMATQQASATIIDRSGKI